MFKNHVKVELSVAIIVILLLCNSFLSFSPDTIPKVYAQEENKYDYYGYVPAKVYQYNLTDPNNLNSVWRFNTRSPAAKAGLVVVLGMKNNTHVKVYSLDNGSLVSETTITA